MQHSAPAVYPLSQTVHDLRQPLSTIETCVFCLRSMLPSDPEIEQYLARIECQIYEASRILADVSRPAAG
jgi:hypothetical protein